MNTPWLTSISMRLDDLVALPPQALCIAGVQGLGQDDLALDFVRKILQTPDESIHPDYLLISSEEGKAIGIDTIREIYDFCLIAPTRATRKVVLIQDADLMTPSAQQAFLKTLEEPVVPTSFVMLSTQLNKLLPTLRSRCQVFSLAGVSYEQAQPWFDSQKISLTPEDYVLTDGAPLFVQTPDFEDRKVAYHMIKQALNNHHPSADILKQLVKAQPLNVLAGIYYALMHEKQFALIDSCIALRKKYTDNANLNWAMQLNAFLLEVRSHAI